MGVMGRGVGVVVWERFKPLPHWGQPKSMISLPIMTAVLRILIHTAGIMTMFLLIFIHNCFIIMCLEFSNTRFGFYSQHTCICKNKHRHKHI